MKEFINPDWENSILNVSATFADFLGVENTNTTLPLLEKELEKNYKNVVFICCDGFGVSVIEKHLKPNDFLRKNIRQTLTSTFPSTTTNATTTLGLNKYPLEHGWLGWTLHFDEINQNIDIYRHQESKTGEVVDYEYPLLDNAEYYFVNAKNDYQVTAIMPEYVGVNNTQKIVVSDEQELCEAIKKVCQRNGKQFAYCYFPEPDSSMHDFGVASREAKEKIESINKHLEQLFNDLTDTLIVITADHSHIDVLGYVEFYKDDELNSLLECPPYLDGRAVAFKVKRGKENEFAKGFKVKYENDFVLFETQTLIEDNYFGFSGNFGYLLGDFIAVGTSTNKQFLPYENSPRLKGHHCSLTKEEMAVPLIVLTKK
ncbi:MAG: alkaline phosphatase family protein [Clostridia bacterium]|nr:alkaline phosphatase family protein [Clostridia bacterium]